MRENGHVSTAHRNNLSVLTFKDALSAEITARRRNAVRLAEAQAATNEGGRESAVQAASGLRARCLELEALVARLTRDIQTAQEDLSAQVGASTDSLRASNHCRIFHAALPAVNAAAGQDRWVLSDSDEVLPAAPLLL